MRLIRRGCPYGFIISLMLISRALAWGQDEPRLRELACEEVSRDALVDILTPKSSRTTSGVRGASRGLGAAPNCAGYQSRLSRGLTVEPVADVAAISIHFEFDSAKLTAEARASADALGSALATPGLSSYCFLVEGHTDSLGSEAYNLTLSRRRAARVIAYLTEHHAIDGGRLISAGYGEARPLAENGDAVGRQRNRRVQVLNLGNGGKK